MTFYPASENQQESAMPEDIEVPKSGSYGAETVPHIESDEEEPNDTGVSDDGESELGSCYELPTGEEECVEAESLPSTEEVYFTSVSTLISNPPLHHDL